jgi:hypothetical protein
MQEDSQRFCYFMYPNQRWAPAPFSPFRAPEREAKKKREKAKAPSAKEEKREFALFPPPTVEIRFQSQNPLGRGKARVLSKMYNSVGVLNLRCPILAVIF